MIVKVFENEEFAGRAAADAIIAQISAKPNSVLGLPTGSTPVPTYRALSAACAEGRVSFKDVKTFNLDEYVGLNPAHEQSYRYFMNDNLFNHVDIDIANTNLPCDGSDLDEATAAKDDEKIIAAGGIDFQLLGIGGNGHIGFNEAGGAERTLLRRRPHGCSGICGHPRHEGNHERTQDRAHRLRCKQGSGDPRHRLRQSHRRCSRIHSSASSELLYLR